MRIHSSSVAVALAAASVCSLASAVTFTPVVQDGDAVTGIGNVTSISNVSISPAGLWAVEVDTDFTDTNTDGAILVPSGVLQREGDAVAPAGASIDSYDSFYFSPSGDFSQNLFLSGTTNGNDDSGIYVNGNLTLQEGMTSIAPQLSAGTVYTGFFDSKIVGNTVAIMSSVDDPSIPTTTDRSITIITTNAAGARVAENSRYKEGDILPGQTVGISDFGTDATEWSYSTAGTLMYNADLAGKGVVYIDDTLIAEEDAPSVVPGRNYGTGMSSVALDHNASGAYLFRGDLDGGTTDDSVLVSNGLLVAREGSGHPDIGSFVFESFGSDLEIDDFGNTLWVAEWNDTNTAMDRGLFLNGQLIMQEGVTTVGGLLVSTINTFTDTLYLDDTGGWGIIEVTLDGNLETAVTFQVPIPEPTSLAGLAAAGLLMRRRR